MGIRRVLGGKILNGLLVQSPFFISGDWEPEKLTDMHRAKFRIKEHSILD